MELGQARYVALTTTKRDGSTVSSPVWIAPLGARRYGFTTGADSGKVKRIRNFPTVTIEACDARGRTQPGSVATTAQAELADAAVTSEVRTAIAAKYGLQFRMVQAMGKIQRLLGRAAAGEAAIVLVLAD